MASKDILVVSLNPEEGKLFLKEVCEMPVLAESGFAEVHGSEVDLQLSNGEDVGEIVEGFGGAIIMVHFMDLITVEKLRGIYKVFERKPDFDTLIAVYKPMGQNIFKVSCLECGQKMWIPDNRQGATGHCPKCKQAFELTRREDHVRMVLGLVEGIPVVQVAEEDGSSFKSALETLLGKASNEKDAPDSGGRTKLRIKKK